MNPEQVMFAVCPRAATDLGTDILLGIPEAAWAYMRDGKTHTFDLRKLGMSTRIIMCGGPDHVTIRKWIEEHNRSLGIVGTRDRTNEDFSIKPKDNADGL